MVIPLEQESCLFLENLNLNPDWSRKHTPGVIVWCPAPNICWQPADVPPRLFLLVWKDALVVLENVRGLLLDPAKPCLDFLGLFLAALLVFLCRPVKARTPWFRQWLPLLTVAPAQLDAWC